MRSELRLPTLGLMMFVLFGCKSGSDPSALKPVQEIRAGEYTVRLLTETGTVKQGSSSFTLEFRNAADNQLADVGTIQVAPVMDMPGMGPMMGTADVDSTPTPGRYDVHQNLSMGGLWKIDVKFGEAQKVRFSVSAE